MDRTTRVLRDLLALGADLDADTGTVAVHEDSYGVVHASQVCSENHRSVPAVTTSLSALQGRMLCPSCAEHVLWELWPTLFEGADLLEYHNLARRIEVPEDPIEARRALRSLQEPFNAIRNSGSGSEALQPVVEKVLAELTLKYDQVKAELRSPRVRELLLQHCRADTKTPGGGEHTVLATMAKYRPAFVAHELYDTVVVSHWEKMVGLGNFLLVLPADIHHWMEETGAPTRWGVLSDPVPVEEGEDVEQLVETVAALWAPKEKSVFSDLAEAVRAARLL